MAKQNLKGGDRHALAEPASDDIAPRAESASASGGVRPLDDAPQTGVPIVLVSAAGVEMPARWRRTRHTIVDEKNHVVWVPTGFWVLMNQSGNQRVPFDPVGWKPYVY